jgi:23S rRNA-/tRNA-specific pseudouridylate synthase
MNKYSHFNIHRKFEREKTKKFFEEKLLNKNKNDNNQKLFKNNSMIINKSEKFKKLTYFIENQIKLNKHEIPYTINTIENKDNSDLDILESLKFIDDLLSENYKEYVYKNKNFNYNKPKRETIFYLEKYNQKLINKIIIY